MRVLRDRKRGHRNSYTRTHLEGRVAAVAKHAEACLVLQHLLPSHHLVKPSVPLPCSAIKTNIASRCQCIAKRYLLESVLVVVVRRALHPRRLPASASASQHDKKDPTNMKKKNSLQAKTETDWDSDLLAGSR
eukprot:285089-Rhodomonas_salina.2